MSLLRVNVAFAALGALALAACGVTTDAEPAPAPAQAPVQAPAQAPVRPNLLFILIDTLRADALGVYGQPLPTSPRIDAFAADAVVYERAWTQYTWTGPSYVSYMTSRYARTHGWDYKLDKPDTFRALDERAPMLAEVIKGAGYATNAQHSQPNLRPDLHFDRGFDVFVRGQDKGVVNGALADIKRWEADGKPNFLYVHLMAPHVPLLPSAESRAAVGVADLAEQISYDHWRAAPAEQKAARLEEFRRTYLACVRDADTRVGTILDALQAAGHADDTVVVIASDHGELVGEHGKIGHFGSTAEALTHVPLIVKIPGTPGRREKAPASMIDIAPTLAELAGAATPAAWQGRSLSKGGTSVVVSERDDVMAISDGTWKVTQARTDGKFLAAHEIANDPSETAQKDETASPTIATLQDAASSWRARVPEGDNTGAAPTLGEEENKKKLEELRALGYVE